MLGSEKSGKGLSKAEPGLKGSQPLGHPEGCRAREPASSRDRGLESLREREWGNQLCLGERRVHLLCSKAAWLSAYGLGGGGL